MFVPGLPLSFKAQCLSQIETGLCVAGRHVVAKTQGYHLVCVWSSLVKFQGGEVVLKIMLYTRVRIFFFFCTGAYPCLSKPSVSIKLMGVCV